MVQNNLVKFIVEARSRGFDDYQIREPLLKEGWSSDEVDKAFRVSRPIGEDKRRVEIYLDSVLLKKIQTRAKKNLLSVPEQIEDILRRSTLNLGHTSTREEKIDDKFITFFSRKGKK